MVDAVATGVVAALTVGTVGIAAVLGDPVHVAPGRIAALVGVTVFAAILLAIFINGASKAGVRCSIPVELGATPLFGARAVGIIGPTALFELITVGHLNSTLLLGPFAVGTFRTALLLSPLAFAGLTLPRHCPLALIALALLGLLVACTLGLLALLAPGLLRHALRPRLLALRLAGPALVLLLPSRFITASLRAPLPLGPRAVLAFSDGAELLPMFPRPFAGLRSPVLARFAGAFFIAFAAAFATARLFTLLLVLCLLGAHGRCHGKQGADHHREQDSLAVTVHVVSP
ncbi:MAG: hypothetical protein NDI59_02900 [Lysobacter sp.]|nr:hypothetical protein [Lysobacter sp.]